MITKICMRRVTATKLPPAAEWPPGASLLVTTVSVAWTDGSDECHGDDLNVPSGGPWPGPPKRSQSFKFVVSQRAQAFKLVTTHE